LAKRQRLPCGLERGDITFEEVGHRPRSSIVGNFDAPAFLDDITEVSLENLTSPGERHRGVGANLFLGSFSVTPLLRHPISGHSLRHWFENEDERAGAAPLAIGEVLLLPIELDALQSLPDRLGRDRKR
jgi:hypothetical protein